MTTIAFKDGVMVGDKAMSYHSAVVTKVFKIEEGEWKGWLFGGSGTAPVLYAIRDWIMGGEQPDLPNDYKGAAMLVAPDGDITVYFDDSLYPITIENKFFAVGSGADYAMGAMAMGATAEAAIGVAAAYDSHTGDEVDVIYS